MDLLAPFIKGGVNDQAMLSAAAWLLIQLGDLPTAEQLARRTISLNANHESALKALVVILQTKNDYDAALEYLERTLKLTPWDSELHVSKADLLDSLDRPQEASTAWKEVLTINPLLHSARQNLIKSLKAAGQVSEAAEHLELLSRLLSAEQQTKSNIETKPSKTP